MKKNKNIYAKVKSDFKEISRKFPLYVFNPEIYPQSGRIFIQVPADMYFDNKKEKLMARELNAILKPYGYVEYGGGSGLDGFYDFSYGPKNPKKWAEYYNVPVPEDM